VALEATIEMLADITVKATKSGGLVMKPRIAPQLGDPALKYPFHIQECAVKAPSDPRDGALLVTLVGTRPQGVGMPWVQVGDPAYHAERYHGADCSGSGVCDDISQFCFVYADKDGKYLSAARGQTIVARTVELPDLDLFQRQNAQTTTKINRNVELAGRVSAEALIYTTSDVRFANALQPTVDSSHHYHIASLGSTDPVKRSLFGHLEHLFDELLRYNDQPALTLQVEVTYDYVLNATVPPVP